MIRRIFFATTCGIVFTVAAAYSFNDASSNSTGSPGGNTGSPGDGRTCRTCHGVGLPAPFKDGLITSNIPAYGYIPGTTYTITATITEAGRSKFGFEISAENAGRQNKGTNIITNTQQTHAVNGGVTHSANGTAGTNGTKSWSYNWKAPAAGTGTITFYAAFNASNSNGTDDSGDNIYTSSLVVKEDTEAGIEEAAAATVKIFPNPVAEILKVEVPAEYGKVNSIEIFDLQGKKLMQNTGTEINISHLSSGTYLLLLISGEKNEIRKFIKN